MGWNRLLSVLVAVSYLGLIGCNWGFGAVLRAVAAVVLPLACIWFGDELGSLTGIRFGLFRPVVTEASPGSVVRLVGWMVLLIIVSLTLFVRFSR